jgi:tetratricopeptide (TPR) repeat protein
MLREFRFEEAAAFTRQALERAGWMDHARLLVRERPFFPNRQRAEESEVFYAAVVEGLRRRGIAEEDPLLAAARENLVSLWTSIGRYEKVIPVREARFEAARRTLPYDDAGLLLARDNLAILYRNAGQAERAAALYADTGLCEHLAPLLAKLIEDGARVVSCCRPWSANCHIWVYVDRVVDVAGAMDPLALHEHRGTHDGSERGLVCRVHDDGLMGIYN